MARRRAGAAAGRGGAATNRYQMREKLVSIGNDYWIENAGGQKVYKVDGKALRVRDTLSFEDHSGNELCKIQEKMVRIKDTMTIEGPDGRTLATVKKAIITPVRDRYSINIQAGADLDVKGNILDHEYRIEQGRTVVAQVSKKWFRVRDTYGVEIAPGQDEIVILAATACIDMLAGN